jgi:predicted ester cyclase
VNAKLASCLDAYEQLWRSDVTDDDIDQVLAPDFVAHTPAGEGDGRDEFKAHVRMALAALDDIEARFEPIAAEGSRVAAQATLAATHTGEFLGVPATGNRLSWREVHVFEVGDGQITEHWMDAGLLAVFMQMAGQAEADPDQPRTVASGLERTYGPYDQLVPLTGYMEMVSSHDASTVRAWATDDYLQHGPFGANVTRDEFEASNRDIVWKALPDISIRLELLLADGELVAGRGLGRGTHTGTELFGIPASGREVTFTETHIYRLRGEQVCEHWLQVDLLGLMGQLRA